MKTRILRSLALALAFCFVLTVFTACANRGKTLLSLNIDGKTYEISENYYQLMLSRVKGKLVAAGTTSNGRRPTDAAFWEISELFDGKPLTLNDYYKNSVLDSCRICLAALYLFDKNGLSLSETEKEEIDKNLEEHLLTDGDGSKTKFNSILSAFGVNYDMLKDIYTVEAKIAALRNHLYSRTGGTIKQKYLEDHYVHFRQIFLANYDYVYETDKNGDVIYYNPSDDSILYAVTDYSGVEEGKKVYYTDDTHAHYAYDSEKGSPAYKMNASGDGYLTEPKSDDEILLIAGQAESLTEQLRGATAEEFEKAITAHSDDAATTNAEFTDGYYLRTGIDYSSLSPDYLYLDTIAEKLADMKVGDVVLVKSDLGFHIVMKYAHTAGAYDKEENMVWFSDFASYLSEEVFQTACAEYADSVVVMDDVYAKTPAMSVVGINYYY